MVNLKDYTKEELRAWFEEIGEKPFRADQVFDWFEKGVSDFDDMTNLSKDLREKLKAEASGVSLAQLDVRESKSDGTRKYLFETEDKLKIESVFMKYRYGNSVCVSSQAGCAMGCSFCASGLEGLERNLSTAEMMDQVRLIQNDTGEKITHIVVMGTGEPLQNFDNVKRFIENLSISKRNITVSTCGLVPEVERLGDELPQVNLAISLHASNDELRSRLLPINRKYPLKELMAAVKKHIAKTGRRVTLEYALIKNVNDAPETIDELIRLVRGLNVHINLIPLNEVDQIGVKGSSKETCINVLRRVEDSKVQVTLRRELGADIEAACGQLRLQ